MKGRGKGSDRDELLVYRLLLKMSPGSATFNELCWNVLGTAGDGENVKLSISLKLNFLGWTGGLFAAAGPSLRPTVSTLEVLRITGE
jgi:hypothetical protein